MANVILLLLMMGLVSCGGNDVYKFEEQLNCFEVYPKRNASFEFCRSQSFECTRRNYETMDCKFQITEDEIN